MGWAAASKDATLARLMAGAEHRLEQGYSRSPRPPLSRRACGRGDDFFFLGFIWRLRACIGRDMRMQQMLVSGSVKHRSKPLVVIIVYTCCRRYLWKLL